MPRCRRAGAADKNAAGPFPPKRTVRRTSGCVCEGEFKPGDGPGEPSLPASSTIGACGRDRLDIIRRHHQRPKRYLVPRSSSLTWPFPCPLPSSESGHRAPGEAVGCEIRWRGRPDRMTPRPPSCAGRSLFHSLNRAAVVSYRETSGLPPSGVSALAA